jgi:hypothetical protein
MTGYGPRGSNYWRDRAQEARARAEELGDDSAIATMTEVAQLYDSMAENVARTERPPKMSVGRVGDA